MTEADNFNKYYNKELKVQEGILLVNVKLFKDEIPIVLLELNESAVAYITRDQYEKALLLL